VLFVHANVEYISNCKLINKGFSMQNHKVVGRFCLFMFIVGGGVSLYGMNNGQCGPKKQVSFPLKVDDNSTNGVNDKKLSVKKGGGKNRKRASRDISYKKYRAKKKQKENDLLDFVTLTTGTSDAKKAKEMALELKNELLALKLIDSRDQSVFDFGFIIIKMLKEFRANKKSD